MHLATHRRDALLAAVRQERRTFAAKIRIVRAILGWSQTDLAERVGLTQRAIHKLEQGDTEPRRATVLAMESVWRDQNVLFEDTADGGVKLAVPGAVLERPEPGDRRYAARTHLGVVAGTSRLRS